MLLYILKVFWRGMLKKKNERAQNQICKILLNYETFKPLWPHSFYSNANIHQHKHLHTHIQIYTCIYSPPGCRDSQISEQHKVLGSKGNR